jgi:hypothetical protein
MSNLPRTEPALTPRQTPRQPPPPDGPTARSAAAPWPGDAPAAAPCTPTPLSLALAALALLLAGSPPAARADDAPGAILPSLGSRAPRIPAERAAGVPDDAALQAAGARIGRIRVDPQEIFDTRVPEENTALFRLGNKLHIRTRPATIETQLLFHEGEAYDPRLLAETERLLRRSRYLLDARITPVAWHDGVVDVDVVTNDVWTLNPGVAYGRKGGANTSGFTLEELNLLGLGSQLSLEQSSGVDRDSRTFLYRDRQLGHSWWRLALDYSDNSDGRNQGLLLDHDFYALDAHWAAGGSVRDDDRVDPRFDLGEKIGEYRSQVKSGTVYGGWSRGLVDGHVLRYTAGLTYDERRFSALPLSALPTVPPPDRKLAYPWVAAEWVQDDFHEVRNRDQIERTEDFAYGWHARAQLGFADGAFGADRRSLVFDTRLGRGIEVGARQTWLFDAALAGRYEDGDLADTILTGSARWYLRQSDRRLLYAALGFDAGRNLDADRQILVGGDTGLRGYPLRYQGGEGRWLFTLEQRAFSNWYPFRLVNVGAAAFVDVGGAWGDNAFGTKSQGVLSDVGVGLRLGNSRSGLGNVLHLDLAFPLNGDPSIQDVQFLVETKRSF